MVKKSALLVIGAALLLSACSGGTSGSATSSATDAAASPPAASPSAAPASGDASGLRTVVDAEGEKQIPADPQRILAIDEYAAMSLLAVGVEPDLIYRTFSAAVSPVVFDHLGLETREEPTFLMEPDYEQVRADQPDLIVMSAAGPLAGNVADFAQIAPTVALSFNEGWQASLDQTGAIFAAEDTAAQVSTALTERMAGLADAFGANPPTMSVLLDYDGTLFHPTPGAAMSQLLADAGIERGAAQESVEGEIPNEYIAPISPEQLDEHDADWVAILAHGAYNADGVRNHPLFAGLSAAQAEHDLDVDGEMWFGSSPFSMWWILSDLQSALLDGGSTATSEQAAELWDDYAQNALGG